MRTAIPILNRSTLIEKHKNLFWYFDKSKLDQMSDDTLTEFILNYGNMEAVKDLFAVIGRKAAAEAFSKSARQERQNYFPEVRVFFDMYFKRHVFGYPFR